MSVAEYVYVSKPTVVIASQWYRNGDLLADESDGSTEGKIVRRFRNLDVDSESFCEKCKRKMCDHGWIDQGPQGIIVCPGMSVMRNSAGVYSAMDFAEFHENFILG